MELHSYKTNYWKHLSLPVQINTTNSRVKTDPISNPSSKKSNAGAIAGGAIGGVVFIAALAALFLWRRKSKPKARTDFIIDGSQIELVRHSITPFNYPTTPSPTNTPAPSDQEHHQSSETLLSETRATIAHRTKSQKEMWIPLSSSELGQSSASRSVVATSVPDDPPPRYRSGAGLWLICSLFIQNR